MTEVLGFDRRALALLATVVLSAAIFGYVVGHRHARDTHVAYLLEIPFPIACGAEVNLPTLVQEKHLVEKVIDAL